MKKTALYFSSFYDSKNTTNVYATIQFNKLKSIFIIRWFSVEQKKLPIITEIRRSNVDKL